MRTIEEIHLEVKQALIDGDANGFIRCAEAFEKVDTVEARAAELSVRGSAYYYGSNYAQALECTEKALAIYEELHDLARVATVKGNLGNILRETGNYAQAMEHYKRALSVHEELGDGSSIATVTGNIGRVLKRTGNYRLALEYMHRSLAHHVEFDDKSKAEFNIDNADLNTDEYTNPLIQYSWAMAKLEVLHNRTAMAGCLITIGNLYDILGDCAQALEYFHRSLSLYEQLGRRLGQAVTTNGIAGVYSTTGNYPLALELYHRALVVHEELGDRTGIAVITGNIGLVHSNAGNYPLALENLAKALAVHEDLEDHINEARITGCIGAVHGKMGNYEHALELFQRELTFQTALGDTAGESRVMGNICEALFEMKKFDEAEVMLMKMESMNIDNPRTLVRSETLKARILQTKGDFEKANSTFHSALETAEKHSLVNIVAEIHKHLRDLAQGVNDFAAYIKHNNEYTRINDEINGKETATKLAMQEKQREIDAKDIEVQKQLAVLHSTLPKHIADRVARGEVVNDHFDNVAVIFLDLVGFTDLSSKLDSRQVIELLDNVFSQCDAICEKFGVTKIKTIGDSYMCASFESVPDAAQCAIEMMHVVSHISVAQSVALQCRIGLHCGPVVAGVLGKERMQYDVWGDTVNVASRMESTSEPGRIHVSEAFQVGATHALPSEVNASVVPSAARDLSFVPRGEIEVKGKGTMKTYWLSSIKG